MPDRAPMEPPVCDAGSGAVKSAAMVVSNWRVTVGSGGAWLFRGRTRENAED